ncbi:MAG: hypothetical protein NTW17_00220 [Candidatus Pacearchaeota archaeon]|nr:hypothetical protein [Candidatus Pacearchaeota archaeon]
MATEFTIDRLEQDVTLREFSDLFDAADEAERVAETLKGSDRFLFSMYASILRGKAEILETEYRRN